MDDFSSQRYGLPRAQRLRAGGLDSGLTNVGCSPPEDVVLTARVDTDHSPHPVVVRKLAHPRAPDEVKDGQFGRSVENLGACAARLAETLENFCGSGDSTGNDIEYRRQAVCRSGVTTVDGKSIHVEHGVPPSTALDLVRLLALMEALPNGGVRITPALTRGRLGRDLPSVLSTKGSYLPRARSQSKRGNRERAGVVLAACFHDVLRIHVTTPLKFSIGESSSTQYRGPRSALVKSVYFIEGGSPSGPAPC